MTRYDTIIGTEADRVADRVADDQRRHAGAGPGARGAMRRNGWRAFDIVWDDPETLRSGPHAGHGDGFAASTRAMGADPGTQARRGETDPCRDPLASRQPGEGCACIDNAFHMD